MPTTMLTIVLPAYNEAVNLPDLIARIGRQVQGSYEILVVDDGSTDGTAVVAERSAVGLPIRVLSHASNQGYGRALRTGLREAARKGATAVTLDADDTHDPGIIGRMTAAIHAGNDLVIASRYQPGGAEVGVPSGRRVLSHGAGFVFQAAIGIEGVRDYTSGFRAYRGSLLDRLIRVYGEERFLEERGFAAGFELLLKAAALGARIEEVPLVLRYDRKRSESKLRVFHTLPRYAALLTMHGLRGRSVTEAGS